jgi:hypothetical protein
MERGKVAADEFYVDEGNNEVFTVEQQDDLGTVHQLALTPVQAFQLRRKLDSWLERHKPGLVKHSGAALKAAAALPVMLLAACKL